MMYLGDQAVGIAYKKTFVTDHLMTLTFVNALGSAGRKTIIPDSSWEKYNMLIFVPHISFDKSSDSGKANNWFWFEISDGVHTNNSYESSGAMGLRYEKNTILLIHDNAVHEWRIGCFYDSRQAAISSDAPLTDLTIKIGPYYGTEYCYMNGTIDVYGLYIKTAQEVT